MKRKASLMVAALFVFFASGKTVSASATGLSELLQQAQKHDARLAQAENQLQSIAQNRKIVESALNPYLNSSASGVIQRNSEALYDLNKLSAGIELSKSLYNRRVYSQLDQTDKQILQAQLNYQYSHQQLLLRLSQAYFATLTAYSDFNLIQAKEEADLSQYQRIKSSADAGLLSKVDLLEAKANLDATQADKIAFENALKNAIEELEKIVGGKVNKVLAHDSEQLHIPAQNTNRLAQESVLNGVIDNLQVQMANLSLSIAQDEVKVRSQANDPVINVFAGYEVSEFSNYDQMLAIQYRDRQNVSIGLNASMPLYDGGLNKAQVSQARFDVKTATEKLRQTREDIDVAIRQAMRNIEKSQAQVRAFRQLLTSSEAFLEATEVSYNSGLRNLVDLLNARTARISAQRNLIAANYALVMDNIHLKALLNQLSIEDFIELDAHLAQEISLK